MNMIAFNNFGFDHLPEARPYVEKGIEGQAQAAHDLGFHAFQLNLYPPQDTAFFERIDVPRLRSKLEELDVKISELYPQHVKSFDDIVDTRRRLEALRDMP